MVPSRRFQFALAWLTSRASLSHAVPLADFVAALLVARPAASGASEDLHSSRDDPFGLETKLTIQFLERRRGAKGFHADDATGGTNIAVPTQHRPLLDGDARLHAGQQYLISIRLRLMLENVPGRHRDNAGSNSLSRQCFVGVNDQSHLASGSNEDDLRRAIGSIGHDI